MVSYLPTSMSLQQTQAEGRVSIFLNIEKSGVAEVYHKTNNNKKWLIIFLYSKYLQR